MVVAWTLFMSIAASDCDKSLQDETKSPSERCKVTLPDASSKKKKTQQSTPNPQKKTSLENEKTTTEKKVPTLS